MLLRQQRRHRLVRQDRSQKLARNRRRQQAITVLAEHRRHPHRIVDAKPHEPAEQEIVVHLLHELAFRADREQHLDQRGAQQPFRRDRRASFGRVERGEFAIERRQGGVDDVPDYA